MLSKKEIKDIQSLALKKHRDQMKLFVAEGPKVVDELLLAIPQQVKKIYATKEWVKQNTMDSMAITLVSDAELERVSELQTPNKVLAVLKQFENYEPVDTSFVIYLDAIQDPGNLGTIIRIADWFGVDNIVCNAGCADFYNSKVIQSTMASIARVAVYYDENNDWLQKQKAPVYAATLHGKSLYEHKKINKGILLIGNESKGLSDKVLALATEKITIPKRGNAESLNAAVATGIILSHIL